MLHKINLFFAGVLILLLSICSLSAQTEPQWTPTIQTVQTATTSTVNNYSDSIRTELVRQTNSYISQRFPKSKLTGEALVMACEKHDFDICFALAQAEIESGLGTAGKAKRTNSPWNVGGMGTYYKAKPGQECEQANLLDPDGKKDAAICAAETACRC